MTSIDTQTIDAESESQWRERPSIRAEFANDRESFLAYRRAEARGLVSLPRAPTALVETPADPIVSQSTQGNIRSRSGPIAFDDSWPEDRKQQAQRIAARVPGHPDAV